MHTQTRPTEAAALAAASVNLRRVVASAVASASEKADSKGLFNHTDSYIGASLPVSSHTYIQLKALKLALPSLP